ncbi:MAG: CCA tRNA nucleotidyltransferase [Sphingobium sp.]|uniref:CCA tRNA nucleotidyltransferase n=1 Tax=Sphingobium sp. TaxID=1912891 RepID=UPI0029A1172C|nr:CCA tRNA nucleotidyltransferase [Sphingobium sp.]MDX3909406.1 CCA tRNA nucleotidyltransferase [Sphingobium sp.]
MTGSLPDAEWRHRPRLPDLLEALGEGNARFVGGAVRDTLLGHPVADVDIATVHQPNEVLRRLQATSIKAVPTGIDHGTVTAILEGWPVEITTLRQDVSTDGRHATVAYTSDWQKDAARRDFTINALFADPASGEITDYFGGLEDLRAGVVRFIGDARARIAEDHLRILRYFRFFARFGKGEPDSEAYEACVANANSLMALSRERIADELLKLLALDDPTTTIRLMVEGGILLPVLPEIDGNGVSRLASLIAREKQAHFAPAALRRLCALLPPDPTVGDDVAARLKLSNKARKRIAATLSLPPPYERPEQLAYWIGMDSAIDILLLDERMSSAALVELKHSSVPPFPLTGGALIAQGLPPGPDVSRALKNVEAAWVAAGFPEGEELEALTSQIVWKFQRLRQ